MPQDPGLGVTPIQEILDELTTSLTTERPSTRASERVVTE